MPFTVITASTGVTSLRHLQYVNQKVFTIVPVILQKWPWILCYPKSWFWTKGSGHTVLITTHVYTLWTVASNRVTLHSFDRHLQCKEHSLGAILSFRWTVSCYIITHDSRDLLHKSRETIYIQIAPHRWSFAKNRLECMLTGNVIIGANGGRPNWLGPCGGDASISNSCDPHWCLRAKQSEPQ